MTRLGGYELRHHLGGNDSAVLWQGESAENGSPALVFVLPAASLSQVQPELSREHAALLPVMMTGVEEIEGEGADAGGRATYLVAPLPQGATPLREVRPSDLPTLLNALQALHAMGAVHGDVRPELLWRDASGQPLLAGAGVPWPRRAQTPAEDVYRLQQVLAGLPASQAMAMEQTTARVTEVLAPAPATVAEVSNVSERPRPPLQPQRLSRWPWLLLILALAGVLGGTVWANQFLQVPQAPAEPWPCCEVSFVGPESGATAVKLRVLDGPALLTLPPELTQGVPLPATLNLPGPGEYRVRLLADGYAPQTVTVTAPSSQPVQVRLE